MKTLVLSVVIAMTSVLNTVGGNNLPNLLTTPQQTENKWKVRPYTQ